MLLLILAHRQSHFHAGNLSREDGNCLKFARIGF